MRITRVISGLSLMCLFFSVSAMAQTTSTIEGTVTDAQGAVVSGAEVKASGTPLASERSATTNDEGFYRLTALPAGTYTLTVSRTGFATNTSNIELTLNRVVTLDIQLQVGNVVAGVTTVTSDAMPLLETNASSTGLTVTPKKIQDLPVNGRNYADLLQLVPGVAINRQSTGDNANPVLGERSGNNNFFIDGQPNKNTVSGGPAAQFNQETIAEFQVLTTGYKAEFGQASGAIINVITKSGGNEYHGVASLFHRNEFFDSSNSLDPTRTEAPGLRRFDYSLAMGGPIWKDRVFFFGSGERITENRAIDFVFPAVPPVLLNLLHAQEDPLDGPQRNRETRLFFKLNESAGRHELVQEINYTNGNVYGLGSGIPSSRRNTGARYLLIGAGDTMTLLDRGNPFILTIRGAYRGEPSDNRPANPAIAGATSLSAFPAVRPCPPTCNATNLFTTLPIVGFGSATNASNLRQEYVSLAANANKLVGNHDLKFGWQFLRTIVNGLDSQTITNQIFAQIDDYVNLGPVNGGIFLLLQAGGLTPEARRIRIRNDYNGLYFQDDWRLLRNLTLNLGLRWENDSEFSSNTSFSPRVGAAWQVTPKTVIRAHFGKFFDQFRLGLVSQVPAFGGSDRRTVQSLYFPRLFYGSPSFIASAARALGLPGPCVSNVLTTAQIAATGAVCSPGGGTILGVDVLNNVVAPGRAPIPPNTAVNINNVQTLTGLTPEQYLIQAAAAIGQPAGYFNWGQFGVLNNPLIPPAPSPVAVDSTFKTPHTLSFSVGVQREITKDIVFEADYHYRDINNLLGLRLSNLAFRSRVAGIGRSFDPPGSPELPTFGPYFNGKYHGLVLSVNKRLSERYLFGASYTYSNATDNSLGVGTPPTDQFVGIVPVVIEPCAAANPGCTRQTNETAPFTSRNGNLVQQAGTFHNGPDLDKGPSPLALDHIFQVNGLVELPWQFQISGIVRAQSGFHFSRFDELSRDPDGNGNFNSIDFTAGRNAFTAPPFVNVDVRFSKRFDLGERFKLELLFEFFNLLNRQNPAAVQNRADSPLRPALRPFGTADQVLPGREGQVGIRLVF